MNKKIDIKDIIPNAPKITEAQLKEARESGKYEFIAFEEYKFISQIVAFVARIDKSSIDYNTIPSQQYYVLIGLMNRCARLILGTMELSHKGKFGETSAIIFRCIFETGVKIIWLCKDSSQEKFDLYINDSLKPEIELKDTITENIKKRNGEVLTIEKRMLESIQYHIEKATTTEEAIRSSKKMLDIATIIKDIGFDRIMYLSNHKIGSHHVHGTWPSLLFHYLEEIDGEFVPRGNNVSTKANEYIVTSIIMARAVNAYCDLVLKSPTKDSLIDLCVLGEKSLLDIFDDMSQYGC